MMRFSGSSHRKLFCLFLLLPAVDFVNAQSPSQETGPFFVDMAQEVGIDFIHQNGMTGQFTLPEITGSGAALFDFDNDGDLDLYLVQGGLLKRLGASDAAGTVALDRLYRNDLTAEGQLRFTDVTQESAIRADGYGMGVATADINNDGWKDLYVTNLGSNQLFLNQGDGTFLDITDRAGANDARWSTSASFLDFDRDGWLDLYITNYVDFRLDQSVTCFSPSSRRDYCGPDAYPPVPDRLLRNLGGGSFQDISQQAGIAAGFGAGLGVVSADFDGDGWMDLYVANDGDPNLLWMNQGDGTFQDEGLLSGSALNRSGRAEAGMGVDAGDFDSDGDEDLFVTHLMEESNTLYVNLGNGFFDDRTIEAGLHANSLPFTAFGTGWFDYDNDGWLDLFSLNGAVRILEPLADAGDAYPLDQPNQLLRNTGHSKFLEIDPERAGANFAEPEVSRGAALGDVDNDGDTDILVLNNSGRARLLSNQIGNRNRWLGLTLLGPLKRESVGSRVEVLRGSAKPIWRRVGGDGGYCSSNDSRVLVGLGNSPSTPIVRVHWLGGKVEEWRDLPLDGYVTLRQGTAPPRRPSR